MGDSILWKYWLSWVLISSPAIPLAYAWRRLKTSAHVATLTDRAPLAIATVSVLWVDGIAASWRFIGPLFDRSHFVIIGGNLIAVFLSGLVSLFSGFAPITRRQRLAAGLACQILALEWARIGIVNR
jgi:hypothetical protein